MRFETNVHSLVLGICALPVLLTYGQTPTKSYSSYRPYPLCNPSDYIRHPKTTLEVVAIVQEAIRRNVRVKAFGARHSQTDIICTEGIPVDMSGFKSFKMNSDGTGAFGPGVTLREAMDYLHTHQLALKTTPAFGNITLGGAIGTGAHGSSIKHHSSISAQVAKMTIVDGRGQIQEISNPQDLNALKLHLGLLGIVVEITLNTVPLYKVLAHNYIVSDDVLTNGAVLKWVKTADQLMLYWFPSFKEVAVANLTFVPVTTPGNAWSSVVDSTTDELNAFGTSIKETAFDLASNECPSLSALGFKMLHVIEMMKQSQLVTLAPGNEPFYSEDGINFLNPAVGYPNLMLASVCSETPDAHGTSCLWSHGDTNSVEILDNEFAIDVCNLPAAIKTIKDIIAKTPTAFPMQGFVIRFSSKNDIYMSTSYKRDTAHMEFLLWRRTDPYNKVSGSLAGYQTITQTLVKKFNARSHWGKSGMVFHNRDALDKKLDPLARFNFTAAMKKFDPEGIFVNNFGLRLTQKGYKVDTDPLTTRCAILDNCFCSKNSDCGQAQICTSVSGYSYNVCRTKNILPEKPFERGAFAQPFNAQDYFTNTIPTLISAANAQCPTS